MSRISPSRSPSDVVASPITFTCRRKQEIQLEVVRVYDPDEIQAERDASLEAGVGVGYAATAETIRACLAVDGDTRALTLSHEFNQPAGQEESSRLKLSLTRRNWSHFVRLINELDARVQEACAGPFREGRIAPAEEGQISC